MKDTKKKSVDKRAIIHDLMAKGFTARKARKALNAVIAKWKLGLWWGEPVEVPGGTLEVKIFKGREWATLQYFQNIATKEPMVRTVHTPGRRRVVKLKPDPTMVVILEPPPPPPPPRPPPAPKPPPPKPETAEEIEERQLVTDLLGLAKLADDGTMAILRNAVGAPPRIPGAQLSPKPGALLRRLREMKARGRRFSFVSELAQQVSEYYWL